MLVVIDFYNFSVEFYVAVFKYTVWNFHLFSAYLYQVHQAVR